MKNQLIIGILLFSLQGFTQNLNIFFEKSDAFFKEYVKEGRVAYDAIHTNQNKLKELFDLAGNVAISKDDKNEYQAFWINAYNLSVIKGIIDSYPVKSPLDKSGFFDKTTYNLAGKKITLNAIENEMLRAKFKDLRFHFALVCGAIGCPPLISKAYLPASLKAQLELQTKIAMNGSFLEVNAKKKRIQASEIMKWYKEDFTMNGTSEIDFINKYRDEKIPTNYKLTYFPYNWNLNKQ